MRKIRRARSRALPALGILGLVATLALTGCGAAPSVGAQAGAGGAQDRADGAATDVIPDSYLVTLVDGDPATISAEHAALGVHVERVFSRALLGYTGRMSAALARKVGADPRVRSVLTDRTVRASAQDVPPGIVRVGAAASSARTGDGTGDVDADIAILDTGIDADHPDLNVAGGTDCVSLDLLPGADEPLPGPPGPAVAAVGSFDDTRGHGTHIAGTAAARDNGTGVAGVAPGARLWAVKVLDDQGNGSLGSLICGIEWVTEQADVLEVANMSLTGLDADLGCRDGALHEAICRSVAAGVTYTVAAGNNQADARDYSPAAYDEVITVSALADFDGKPGGAGSTPLGCPGEDDEFAPFSNHGDDVDLIAPGVCVRSTWPGGGYATLSGTSQAAAHVAGAAALYLAAHPTATPAQVRVALVGAGNTNWETGTDPDLSPDPLLDVTNF